MEPVETKIKPLMVHKDMLADYVATIPDEALIGRIIYIAEQLNSEWDTCINELIARYDRARAK